MRSLPGVAVALFVALAFAFGFRLGKFWTRMRRAWRDYVANYHARIGLIKATFSEGWSAAKVAGVVAAFAFVVAIVMFAHRRH